MSTPVVENPSLAESPLNGEPRTKGILPGASRLTERGLSRWIHLAAFGLIAAMAAPLVLGRVYVADDLGEFHLPLRDFYARQIAHGEPFDWMSQLYGGFYLTGEGQLGGYHPWHLLLYRWLPLSTAFDLELLLSYPFMLIGTYLFARRLLVRNDAAWLSALVFTFSSFTMLHFVHPNAVAILAHVPWLLWAIDFSLSASTSRQAALGEVAIALLTASQLLLGYPQYVWYSLIVEGLFACWLIRQRHVAWRDWAWLPIAKLIGLATAGIQIVPTFDALADSVRAAPSASLAAQGSWHPYNAMQLVAPYLFQTRVVGQNTHELAFYCGAVPLLMCVWLLSNRPSWGRYAPLVKASWALVAIALALALGQYSGLAQVQALLPVLNCFRFPCRAMFLVQLALAIQAGIALAIVRERSTANTSRRDIEPLVWTVAASVLVVLMAAIVWPEHTASPALMLCGPLLLLVGTVLLVLALRNVRDAWPALILFMAVDLGAYGLSYAVWPQTVDLDAYIAATPTPPVRAGGRIAASETPGGMRTGNRMLLAGLSRVDGYAGLEPRKQLDYHSAKTLALAGAAWVFDPSATVCDESAWQRVPESAPRARLLPDDVPGAVEIVADTPGRLEFAVQAPAQQLLATTESFHSGWRATIDGQPSPVVRVNSDFLGCVVEPNARHVVLEFQPTSLLAGKLLSICGLGLMCGMYWIRRHR